MDGHPLDGSAMDELIEVIQELSLARTLPAVQAIVRSAARRLTGADGATFVLRDGACCYYADEDAISPLWKGQRFPMATCISGWVMQHRQPVVIEDIFADERIPHDAYRPTFVKSLAMVPIRQRDPIGAIGNYWADHRVPSPSTVRILQALSDSTAVAMENVAVYNELEQRIEARTQELAAANRQLDSAMRSLRDFVAVAAHDLRGPIATFQMATRLITETTDEGRRAEMLRMLGAQADHLGQLTDDLLTVSVIDAGQLEIAPQVVALRPVVEAVTAQFDGASMAIEVGDDLTVKVDPAHLRRIIDNLIRNALRHGKPPVELSAEATPHGIDLRVSDHGPGVAAEFVPRLFERFSRAAVPRRTDSTGLGLSIVQELARANGGDVRYEGTNGAGARFTVRFVPA